MRDRTNQPVRSVPGQLCIGIQRDDIPDSGEYGEVSDLDREAVRAAPHEVVQIL